MSLPPQVVEALHAQEPKTTIASDGIISREKVTQTPYKKLKRVGWCNWGRRVEEPELNVNDKDYDFVLGFRETNDMAPFLPEVVVRILSGLNDRGITVDPLMPKKELTDVKTQLFGVAFDFDTLVSHASRMGLQKRASDGKSSGVQPVASLPTSLTPCFLLAPLPLLYRSFSASGSKDPSPLPPATRARLFHIRRARAHLLVLP